MRFSNVFLIAAVLSAMIAAGGCATGSGARVEGASYGSPLQQNGNPYMGDYQGKLGSEDVCAQVIAWDNRNYQMNLLNTFDTREPALAVLKGKKTFTGKVKFRGEGAEGPVKGARLKLKAKHHEIEGKVNGKEMLEMGHVVRLSPALGAKPPEGAMILFDGKNLDAWEQRSVDPWGLDITRLYKKDNAAVYLRTRVFAAEPMKVQFAYGCDDGAKVWVNGKEVHSVIEERKVTPCRNKAAIDLVAGQNDILVKVVNKEKSWGLSAKLRNLDGSPLENVTAGPSAVQCYTLAEFDGDIAAWEISGVYTKDKQTAEQLLATAFAPESNGKADWKAFPLPENPYPGPASWQILPDGSMEVTHGSIQTKQKFANYQLHTEFRTPFVPGGEGQNRGNSGVFNQNRYEVQILDSYGLSGENNECGGIYKTAVPRVNMCAPPLQWQSYDIEFHAAIYDKQWNKVKDAEITVVHNGVTVQDKQPVPDKTTGSQVTSMSEPGQISLQDHSHPVRFRNIWLVELPK
jgi:3-keto-disaccharide hydrolase